MVAAQLSGGAGVVGADLGGGKGQRMTQRERMRKFIVDRRGLLEGFVWLVGYRLVDKLVDGFIGGIPWRVIDSITSRQDASKPRRHRVDAGVIHYSWHLSEPRVSIKRAPTA